MEGSPQDPPDDDRWATNVWSPPASPDSRTIELTDERENISASFLDSAKSCIEYIVLKGCNCFRKCNVGSARADFNLSTQSSLSTYLKVMRKLGLWMNQTGTEDYPQNIGILCKVVSSFFYTLSILYALGQAKYHALNFLSSDEQLDRFIGFAYGIIAAVTKSYFLYFLYCNGLVLTEILRESEGQIIDEQVEKQQEQRKRTLGFGLAITTVILAATDALLYFYKFNGWVFEDSVRMNAFRVSRDTLLWRPSTFEGDIKDVWDSNMNGEMSPSISTKGFLGGMSFFCGWVHEGMLQDAFLLIAFSVRQHLRNLNDTLQSDEIGMERKWHLYKETKARSEKINNKLGILLPLASIQNVLLVSYFLLKGFKQQKYIHTFVMGFQVAKLAFTYYLACSTANDNKRVLDWIKVVYVKNDSTSAAEKMMKKSLLLDALLGDRVGLGNGEFYIDQGFLIKFVGMVSTIFMLLQDHEKRDKN